MLQRLIAPALALIISSAAQAQSPDWDKVVDAAKKEGSVVYFTALGGPHEDAPLKAFQDKYGIRVEKVVGRASEVRERVKADNRAGRHVGDLYVSTQANVPLLTSDDLLELAPEVPNMSRLSPAVSRGRYTIPITITPYGILVNTRLVPPADEPKSWRDLTDPKWQGKMLSDDLRIPGAGQAFFEPTYRVLGRGFHEKLAAQKSVLTRNNREGERQVARGEYSIIFPQILPFALQLKGLPVKFIIPEEGATYAQAEFALLKNAPHPNAARLLIHHFLEPDTQLAFANAGVRPVTQGVVEKANPDVRPLHEKKLLGSASAEGQAESLKLASEIYK